MSMPRKTLTASALGVAAALLAASASAAPVEVYFEPQLISVDQGETFFLDLVADIPEPVFGWGLDLEQLAFEPDPLTYTVQPVSPWIEAPAADGDGLAAFAHPFMPPNFPDGVQGIHVVLATIMFEPDPDFTGTIILVLSATEGDPTEGFPLRTPGLFADLDTVNTVVTVVPEPAALLLLAGGGAWAVRGRRIATARDRCARGRG